MESVKNVNFTSKILNSINNKYLNILNIIDINIDRDRSLLVSIDRIQIFCYSL